MPNPSAIYELNKNGEATGIVHFFCSHGHAEADFEAGAFDGTRVAGPSGIDHGDIPQGTVCERCGVLVEAPEPRRFDPKVASPVVSPNGGDLCWFKYQTEWRPGRVALSYGEAVTTVRIPVKHDADKRSLSASQSKSIYWRNRTQVFPRYIG